MPGQSIQDAINNAAAGKTITVKTMLETLTPTGEHHYKQGH